MTSIIKVDQIQNTSGTTALTIDSSGYTLPKVPLFKVELTSNFTVNHNTVTLIDWSGNGQVVYDNTSAWDSANERWQPTQAGYYMLGANIEAGSGTLRAAGIQIQKNGSVISYNRTFSQNDGDMDDIAVGVTSLIYLDGDDYVTMHAYVHDALNSTDLIFGGNGQTTFQGYFVST